MEDIKRRLEFRNTSVQVQAAWKLYNDIIRKKSKDDQLIDAASPESVELHVLWEWCYDGEDVVVRSCAQALCQLVYSGTADFTYVLNGLLNLVPSARNLAGIIQGVAELLTLQVQLLEAQKEEYQCPYSLRTPPHPFISILTNRPSEAWPLLQQEVLNVFAHHIQSIQTNGVALLAPFLQFVLFEPQQSAQYAAMRHLLQGALLRVCRKASQPIRTQLMNFLTNHLACFQCGASSSNVSETFQFMRELSEVALTDPESHEGSLGVLCGALLGLLHHSVRQTGWSCAGIADAVLEIAQQSPKAVSAGSCIVVLGDLLTRCSLDLAPFILSIARIALSHSQDLDAVTIGMLILPVLQIISLPSTVTDFNLNKSHQVASGVIQLIESGMKFTDREEHNAISIPSHYLMTSRSYEHVVYSKLARQFSVRPRSTKSWLENLRLSLPVMKAVPRCVTNLIVSLLVTSLDAEVVIMTLEVITDIATKDSKQAPNFLAVLLYQLAKEPLPERRLALLHTIPCVATHKACVAPILRTIQMVGNTPKLLPMSLHLLTVLWKLQDRCFPHLYKALAENDAGQSIKTVVDELMVARAASMKDICCKRPHHHGADLLAPLSAILNECGGEEGSVPTALALEGLYFLCEAEVINLRSVWLVLADTLGNDKRPVVVEKICDLLSLAPKVDLCIAENETFLAETVSRLWSFANSSNDCISGAAYQALASFTVDNFKLSYLPERVISDFREQAERLSDQNKDPGFTVDSLMSHVPGCCYTRLLKTVRTNVLPDFSALLSSLLRAEVENMPRGIYHSSLRQPGSSANQNKAVRSIPGFILSHYEKTKQLGLRQSLAVGLLFCYDPPIEVGRDGHPRRHYIVTRGKNYQHMLTTLLHEVPIQPSEWHKCTLQPQAWTSFVARVYLAVLEGRKTEIELQARHQQIQAEEVKAKQDMAWLWSRDHMTDAIKAASRGSPAVQGNSALALAGLATCVGRYASGLDANDVKKMESATEHKSHSHWLSAVMDSLMSLMDVKFQPMGPVLGMCQQRALTDRLQVSLLARSAAAVSLSQLIPILITVDADRIYQMIDMLKSGLPGQPSADPSAVVQFHCGLGLGMLLARLFEERFLDVSGTKGMIEVWKAMDNLEECCLTCTADHRQGSMLGLGAALCSLSADGKTESTVHVQLVQEKLFTLLEKSSVNHNLYQTLSFTLACVSGASYAANILSVEKVNAVLDKFSRLHVDVPQNTGVCLSLGMLCYSLSKIGHPTAPTIQQQLISDWTKKITNKDSTPLQTVAILNGLMSLIGSERSLVPVQGSSSSSADASSGEVIRVAMEMLTGRGDLGIQCNSAWMLGHLYLSSCTVSETQFSVTHSYVYLPDSSILKALVDFLLEAGKNDSEPISPRIVEVALSALQEEVKQVLPPVNWAGILSPFMRMNLGSRVKCLCLTLAISQSGSSPPAAMFITIWLAPGPFASLENECRCVLFDAMPMLIKSISPVTLRKFLFRCCTVPFSDISMQEDNCVAVINGLFKALQVPDPPDAVTSHLYEIMEHFYTLLPKTLQPRLYSPFCDCLAALPDELFDKIILEDFKDSTNHIKGSYVRCHLVAKGRQSLALLNSCIDATLNDTECDKELVIDLLTACFYQTSHQNSETTGVMCRLQWLLEFLGHTKNIAVGAIPLRVDNSASCLPQVLSFALTAVSAAVCLWSSSVYGGTLGLHPNWLSSKGVQGSSKGKSEGFASQDFLTLLPASVVQMDKPPWDQILGKVIDWLLIFSKLPDDVLDPELKCTCKAALLALRHTADFKKAQTWTRVLQSM